MGTPSFAVPTLEALVADNDIEVVAVITSVDKLGGRGRKVVLQSDVKKFALKHGLKVLQPPNLKAGKFVEEYNQLRADLAIVVAFRMLPEVIWSAPRFGTMNLHASLLPAYRGAAPINWAIINGETESGLTTFMIAKSIDTGNIIYQVKVPIGINDTAGTLHDRMMHIGAELVVRSTRDLLAKKVSLIVQDDALATRAPKIFHEDCRIDPSRSAVTLYNFVRGLSPYPGAWIMLDGKILKIYFCTYELKDHDLPHGSIESIEKNKELRLYVSDGYILPQLVQIAGRKKMNIQSFLNGYDLNSSDNVQIRK